MATFITGDPKKHLAADRVIISHCWNKLVETSFECVLFDNQSFILVNSVHAFLFFYLFFASLFPLVKGFFHLSISVGCASRTVAFLWPSGQLY